MPLLDNKIRRSEAMNHQGINEKQFYKIRKIRNCLIGLLYFAACIVLFDELILCRRKQHEKTQIHSNFNLNWKQ